MPLKGGIIWIPLVDSESFSQAVSEERIMGSRRSMGGFWKMSLISVASEAFFWFVCCCVRQAYPLLDGGLQRLFACAHARLYY